MITLSHLTKHYGITEIFKDASFSFPDTGLVCVLGPSGCGKTTLLNLLAGFDTRYDGEITVHGASLSSMDARALCSYRRDNVGFVFQNYHLLSGYTAVENILLATDAVGENRKAGAEKAAALLARLGLSGKENQKIETLSGGQKQRVAIARALVNEPSILLADEPTGALDRQNSGEIMELLRELAKTRLVIVITHDPKCAEYASQVVALRDGKLVSDQTMAEGTGPTALKTRKAPKLPLWKRAWKNFSVHFPRYVAIALAISLGVLCFTLSLSSGNRMEEAIRAFEEKNTALRTGYIRTKDNTQAILDLLSRDPRLENVYPQYVLHDVTLKFGDTAETMAEKYPMAKSSENLSYGVMPRMGKAEIALTPSLAAKFHRNIQSLIGKDLELSYQGSRYTLTVSGICSAGYDDFFLSADLEQQLYRGRSGEGYSVSYDVADFDQVPAVTRSLTELGYPPQSAANEVSAFLDTFHNLNRLFAAVSLLIFGASLFISTILLVKQQNTRFREMGLLAALGYPHSGIRTILFLENLMLAILSTLCGALLTPAAMVIGNATGHPLLLSPVQILLSMGFPMALLLVISAASSFRLTHAEPAQALRK